MLEEVRIRNLGVIADAKLPLASGFTVVTGETGAGKTMVVAGLSLLFGSRADAAAITSGADSADVEGRLHVPADSAARRRVEEAGGTVDEDGTLILARQISGQGRSRASAGGRSVPVGVLSELGSNLLSVHGQSSQVRLAQPAAQRELLDRFGGAPLARCLAAYRSAYEQWRTAEASLADRQRDDADRQREIQLLQFGLEQIERAHVQPGEDAAIDSESRRLANADQLRVAVQAAHAALDGPDDDTYGARGVADLVAVAQRALADVAAEDDQLADLAVRLREIGVLVMDASSELTAYADNLAADPARLEQLLTRRAELRELIRVYGGADGADGVLAWAQRAAAQLGELDTSQEALDQLRERCAAARRDVAQAALELTAARTTAAKRLSKAVSAELSELALGGASLQVRLSPRAAAADRPTVSIDSREQAVGASGADDVRFEISNDAGATARSIERGASGGELSRIMLALEVVLAGTDPVATMVFDEVDAGVGGAAAIEIGRRLARLGIAHQVIAVTHLPQVAAYADHHVVIEKSTGASVSRADIRVLEHHDRLHELTRMMAGLTASDSGKAHAAELVELAERDRAAMRSRAKSRRK